MNRAITAGALLCIVACAHLNLANAAATPAQPPLIEQLSSPDAAARRVAAGELSPERIAQLPPEIAVRAAVLSSQDSDEWIRQSGLGALGVLANLAGLLGRSADDRYSHAARPFYENPDVRRVLERIIREDQSVRAVFAAASPFMAAFGSDTGAEAVILDRVDKLSSPHDQARLLQTLAIGGPDGAATIERLAAYVRNDAAPINVQQHAAKVLLLAPALPQDLSDDYLRLLEHPDTFADPALLPALLRFSAPPGRYIARLQTMQKRLELELLKPPAQRAITVYNDDYVKRKLDEAVAALQSRAVSPGR